MNAFDYAFEETLGKEGKFSDDPDDKGGKTNYGITEAVFKDALNRMVISGVSDIKDLAVAQAKAIYKTDYWHKIHLGRVDNMYVAAEIFDTAVNSGRKKAVILAQMALDYLGETLAIDGIMGSQTLGLINKWSQKDERALLVALNGLQFIHFLIIVDDIDLVDRLAKVVKGDPAQTKFARGWTKRVSFKEV